MIDILLELDTQCFLFLNHLGNDYWDGFWLFCTQTWFGLPVFLILLYFSFIKLGWRSTLLVLISTIIIITTSDQLSNLFKNVLVKRPRPCYNEFIRNQIRLVGNHCGGLYGYFSAHASNSFSVATFFLSIFYRKSWWLSIVVILWAVLTTYSRIYVGVHYPLDVLTGVVFGIFIGRGYHYFLKSIISKMDYLNWVKALKL